MIHLASSPGYTEGIFFVPTKMGGLRITDTDLIHVIELDMNNSKPFSTVQLNINANRASGVFLV
jgi:hypothetical protein